MIIHNFRFARRSLRLASILSGLAALMVLVIAPLEQRLQMDPEKIRSRFESLLQKHEDHIREQISALESELPDYPHMSADNIWASELPGPGEREMTVLIYRNDSLIYWSDNRIPVPHLINDGIKDSPDIIRLANGWYERMSVRNGSYTLVCLCLVKQEYPFQNQYLRNHYSGVTGIPDEVAISLSHGPYNILSQNGTFLCSLQIPPDFPLPGGQAWLAVFLMIFYLFLIIFLHQAHIHLNTRFGNTVWSFLLFVADVVIFRGIQFAFKWPETLYESELFSPVLYYSSWFLPSLGDFLVNSFIILVITALFARTQIQFSTREKHGKNNYPGMLARAFICFTGLFLVMMAVNSLVKQSTLPMNLENVSRLSWNSLLAFAVIGFLALSWILFTMKLILPCQEVAGNLAVKEKPVPFGWFFLASVMFSLCATVVLSRANRQRDENQREQLAIRLVTRQSPETEKLLFQTVEKIKTDSIIGKILNSNEIISDPIIAEDSVASYLLNRYFRGYWNNFNVQVTVCRGSKILRIQPQGFEMKCSEYFEGVIASYGKSCRPEIYFLDYGYGNENYLVRIVVPGKDELLFIEISSRGSANEPGYPELLVDRSTYDFPDPGDYSYAFYQDNQLVHRVGAYIYGFELTGYIDTAGLTLLPSADMTDHFLYMINKHEILIISKPVSGWLNLISPFSYLLFFVLISGAICLSILNLRGILDLMIHSLRNRLQISMFSMILALFLITGVLMLVYLFRLNSEKNEEELKERTLSILIEVEHKFDRFNDLRETGPDELENVLIKFSNVFFSDINLFEPGGVLLATSRPRIFNEGLTSGLINSQAFRRLQDKRNSIFVQIENIGGLSFLSAYVPFYNTQDKLLGYLNLPYFSRQDDLRREISTFLVAFINIYLIFILLGVLVTYLVSNYITSPLKLLAQRIGRISIDRVNEKLTWNNVDEIGKLVDQYNRMLDELAVSAEKLAASERQTAWKEMARQVAHEIKNPLTPMRLGIQYLQKAWEERAGDWDARLKRFTDGLLAQIDTLSTIASEFSYFARMPDPENETLSLDELVTNSLAVYREVPTVQFEFNPPPGEKWIYADRRQMLRVFGNLLNNAVEAIEALPGQSGKIIVETGTSENRHAVHITDNGKGIRPGEEDRIFQPNFTTRSGGAGLGLAIVKGIVDSAGGAVSFTSDPGKKTTFTILLPVASPPVPDREQ